MPDKNDADLGSPLYICGYYKGGLGSLIYICD